MVPTCRRDKVSQATLYMDAETNEHLGNTHRLSTVESRESSSIELCLVVLGVPSLIRLVLIRERKGYGNLQILRPLSASHERRIVERSLADSLPIVGVPHRSEQVRDEVVHGVFDPAVVALGSSSDGVLEGSVLLVETLLDATVVVFLEDRNFELGL